MKSEVVRNVDALCLGKVPYYMSVTIVTTVIRCACAIERTVHQLREIVNGITANVDDRIYTLRNIEFICTCRKVENKYISLCVKAGRNRSLYFCPSAAALCSQNSVGRCLGKFVTGICASDHCGFSLTEVSGNAFYKVIRLRTERIIISVNVRGRRNFEVTAESIELIKTELTCYRELRKSFFAGSCVTACERILTLELGISTDRESTRRVVTFTITDLEVAEAIKCVVKRVIRIYY